MYRFTTPHITYTLSFETSQIKCASIYIKQGEVFLEKKLNECTLKEKEISVKLSQEETAMFECHKYVKIQLHIIDINDEVMLTKPVERFMGECLGKGVLK